METRTRTVEWEDPLRAAREGAARPAIEWLRAIQDGLAPPPPIARLLGFRLASVEEGRAVFEVEPAEYHYNPIGVVHGGLAATLLDSAMGCAVHSMLPPGRAYTTVELKVNYVRPLTRGMGVVRATGTVLHLGKRTALAEGRIVDGAERLLAHATTTCLVFDHGPLPGAPA